MFFIPIYAVLIYLLVRWVDSEIGLIPRFLLPKSDPAAELEEWLKKFSWGNRSQLSQVGILPQYKFYSEVLEVLLSLARKMGGSYQESVLFLREGLQADRQFEKRIKEAVLGAWIQMGFMVLLTWGFILGAQFIVEIKIDLIRLGLIGLWQLIGLGFLPVMIHYFRKKYFKDIGKLWKIFYILKALSRVPLSRSEIFTIAGLGEINLIKQKTLFYIVDNLKQACQKALQMGGSYEEELLGLMHELRFQEKWHFELFEKRLMVIKLVLMSIFFLPSYLIFIFLLLKDLLVQM